MNQLLSRWRLKDVEPGGGVIAELALGGGAGWIDVRAPGDTYLALVDAKRLDHPFVGRNEAAAEWVRHREWWWHCRFDLDPAAAGDITELVFEGLDTIADVYLDGTRVASSDNMFRRLRLDLGGLTGSAGHDLAVRFHPAASAVAGRHLPAWRQFKIFHDEGRALMRKAQYGWGWDWGPNLPTVGIWKPVHIDRRSVAAVSDLAFTTLTIGDEEATVRIDVELTAPASVAIELLDPDGKTVAEGGLEESGSLVLSVPQPQLWWTADLGTPALYTLTARTPGAPDRSRRVGIRTVALDQSPDPDEPGATFFRFVLNGVPIFSRGACWIPASSFIGAVPRETYVDLVASAAAANMNMLRVWGGGIYEDDAFYDACDAAGLLVWQDFMFACAPYPEDDAFIANVRGEVAEQVRRLRSHACLALWCGNNEIQLLQAFDNHVSRTDDILVGLPIFERHIPEILVELDPVTPYWPSSPWGGPNPNSMRRGDVHNWTVWHGAAPVMDADPIGPLMAQGAEGIHFTRYAEDMARFVSEFGIHGAPSLATLRRWMAPEDLTLDSEGFRERNKDHGDKANKMASLLTGRPKTIEEYVDFTGLLQAEGLAFGIEHFRRRRPHCSGALVWQLNDCWPCISWSLIDHDGAPKASYFAVKRAFAPVLASFRRGEGNAVELWITNDTLAPIADVASIALTRLDGGEDWRTDVAIDVAANQSVLVWRSEVSQGTDQVLTVRAELGGFQPNRLLAAAVKDLALSDDPGLGWLVEDRQVTVTAAQYALAVHVETDDPAVRFDDNYFDLPAGGTRTIAADRTISDTAIRISSWADRHAAGGTGAREKAS